MEQELESVVDKLNAGEPVPQVEPEDLRTALAFLSQTQTILNSARQRGTAAARSSQQIAGFFVDDLAVRCTPNADAFAVALRAVLASVILQLARTDPERLGPDFIIRTLAEMPLVAAELKDPEAIRLRIDEMAGGQKIDSEA